jgi:uncharacterized phage-like protein YoqJ
MKVESLEFWQKVKEEYRPLRHFSICFTSSTFSKAWNKPDSYTEKSILKLADEFKTIHKLKISIGIADLFELNKTKYNEMKLRVNFIDYCIAKYSAP